MTRIAFAADLHADDFGSKVDPATGLNARFVDALEATTFIARTARRRDAAALIVAGDYTEHRSPSPPRVAAIQEALVRGPSRQIHLRGNHDSERSGRSIVDVLAARGGWEGHTRPGISLVDDVAICAIPFLGTSWIRAQPGLEQAEPAEVYRVLGEQYVTIARGLFAEARRHYPALTPVLIGHQQLAGASFGDHQTFLSGLDLVVDARALAAIGYAAVIFGHVHRAQTVVDDPDCPVIYVGSAHRVDFAEEHEDKSFVVADVAGGRVSIERVEIPSRRFVTIRGGEIGNHDDIEGAVVRVLDLAPELDVARVRRSLEVDDGAFEVQEIRVARPDAPAIEGGMAEGLAAEDALEQYFDGDDDAEAIVERGRGILAEVAS